MQIRAAVLEEFGQPLNVTEVVKPGDHVVTLFSPQCGECVHCRSPKANGEPARLLLWGPDYDGTHKAWVRLADGTEHVVGGSQVRRA